MIYFPEDDGGWDNVNDYSYPNSTPNKSNTTTNVATEAIKNQQNSENNSAYSFGSSFFNSLIPLSNFELSDGGWDDDVDNDFIDNTVSNKANSATNIALSALQNQEILENGGDDNIGSSFYNSINNISKNLKLDELLTDAADIFLQINGEKKIEKNHIDADFEYENADPLDKMILQWNEINQFKESVNSSFSGVVEQLTSIADLIPLNQQDPLFSTEEKLVLDEIRHKISNKIKLSNEEVEKLLAFSQKEKKNKDSTLEIIKDKMIYKYSFFSKNFVSLIGASIAGMIAGPNAAFATHHCIGNLWKNYISEANPKNRIDQIAMLFINGVVGSATGGVPGALALTASQALQDEASTSVNNAISAVGIAYLANLAGAQPLQVGLLWLLILKGQIALQTVKADIKSLIKTIKNPRIIPSETFEFVTKIAKDCFFSVINKKWAEVGSLSTVVVISLSSLVLGSSVGITIGTSFVGIYLTNRIFHSLEIYKGEATLANEDFCKWTVNKLRLVNNTEDQIESLKEILKDAMGERYEATAKAIDEIAFDSIKTAIS